MRTSGTHLRTFSLIFLILLSGCANISVQSTVNADGTIETYQMQINTSTTVYGFLNEGAKEDGYDSLKDQFTANIDEDRAENIEYDENFEGDDVSITLTISDFEPASDSAIEIEISDGTMTYEDTAFVNESADESGSEFTSGIVVQYRLVMPGEITDSNADEVDGNTAEWRETGMDALTENRIYAESKIPSVPLDGFGIGIALVSILATIGITRLGLTRF